MDSVITEPKRRSFFKGMLPFFVVAHFAHHLLTALPTPLLPFIRNEFNLDYTRSALVVSAFGWTNGFSQIPAGWLADRIGTRILLTVGISGVALGGILVGLSHTYIMLIVFLVLLGLLCGGYHPSAAPMVSALVEPENRGRALGIHEIGAGGSLFLAPIIAAGIAAALGWRGSFIVLAIPVLIFGLIFYKILGRKTDIRQAQPETTTHYAEAAPPPRRWRHLVVFMFLSLFTGGVSAATVAFIPLYLVDHFGVSEQTAASLLSIIYSAGLWASPVGGYISDRLGRVPVIIATSLISCFVIYSLNLASYGLGIGVILFFLGITIFGRMPVAEAYIISQTTERNRSTVYGIYYFSMTETGAVLAPVMGTLIDHFGFHTSFAIASIVVLAITIICSLFLLTSRS
jgi:MFS family permease